nr:hypothetical protein [Clostridia bacterium]
MKKIISLVLVSVLLALCFASCGTHPAAKALDEMLIAVKNGDFAKAAVLENTPLTNENNEMLSAMYKTFNYSIDGVVAADDTTATVGVVIDTVDMGKVFADFLTEAIANVNNPEWGDEEAMFIEKLGAEDAPRIEFAIDVAMEKVDGTWVLADENETFIDALCGGLISSLSGLLEE